MDTLAREFRDRGARIDLSPMTQPWGAGEIHVRDFRLEQVLGEEIPN
ncbi:MAG: hypothetical protein Q6L68_13355 [Thermostichus sp. DG02_5_bins_236]